MTDNTNRPITYRDAGVDIDAGNQLVSAIKPLVRATQRSGADGDVGGFGGIFDLKQAGYSDPVLVAGTDGVGTKLKIAIESGRHHTIGIDLVAMCVNDLIVQGAEPLFFLDYLATGHLNVETARDVIAGIASGCREAGCALIGGETAEMPGMYQGSDYDLAGFAVGAVERRDLLPRRDIALGDVLIGLSSSGVHSNGYSLVRRLVREAGLDWTDRAPWEPTVTVAEALLNPTRIYVKSVLAALRETGAADGPIKAISHITGGGLTENLPRVLSPNVGARVDLSSWRAPAVFGWLAETGRLDSTEMLRTFNCGIGLVVVADRAAAAGLLDVFARVGETATIIGEIAEPTGSRTQAKGHGETEAVTYADSLEFAS